MRPRWSSLGSIVAAGAVGALVGAAAFGEIRGAEHAAPAASTPPAVTAMAPGAGAGLTLGTFQAIAHQDDAAIVNISTSKVVHQARMQDPFFEFFKGNGIPFESPFGRGGDETLTQRSLGSGFVVDAKGFVLTNRHVVDGADDVVVTLANGHHYKAKTVGQDARTDIALLKIEPHETLAALPLGDSDETEVGQWVMAVGNPFGLGGNSVTVGVVSFKGRPLDLSSRGTPVEMLQTDAAINPGNSGGPLIDARGQAIGINTLIVTGGAQQYSGVGFAVPINVAREILPQLRDKGEVVRGYLGVQIQGIDEDLAKSLHMQDTAGALVANVTAHGPADEAGLKPGDVIRDLNGKPVKDSAELSRGIAALRPGQTVELKVLRDGRDKTLSSKLGTFPDESQTETASAEGQDKLGMSLLALSPDLARRLDMSADARGVAVLKVEPGSRADAAGLHEHDVIVSVDGQPVADVASFRAAIDKARSADVARLRVRRGEGYLFLAIRLS
jgi:serine protease Do